MPRRKDPFTTQQSVRPDPIPGKGFYRDPKQQPQPLQSELDAMHDHVNRHTRKIRKGRKK